MSKEEKQLNNTCYKCHGNMTERKIDMLSGWGDYELTIKGVNAFVCDECGVISLKAEEVKRMEDISRKFAELPEEERPDYFDMQNDEFDAIE